MKLFFSGRPSALPAALVPVVAAEARAAATAHVVAVGQPAVRSATAVDGCPQQLQVRTRLAAYLADGGNADKGIDGANYVMKGASGVPPRSRPV